MHDWFSLWAMSQLFTFLRGRHLRCWNYILLHQVPPCAQDIQHWSEKCWDCDTRHWLATGGDQGPGTGGRHSGPVHVSLVTVVSNNPAVCRWVVCRPQNSLQNIKWAAKYQVYWFLCQPTHKLTFHFCCRNLDFWVLSLHHSTAEMQSSFVMFMVQSMNEFLKDVNCQFGLTMDDTLIFKMTKTNTNKNLLGI